MNFIFVWCIQFGVFGLLDPRTECHQIKPVSHEVCQNLMKMYSKIKTSNKIVAMCLRD